MVTLIFQYDLCDNERNCKIVTCKNSCQVDRFCIGTGTIALGSTCCPHIHLHTFIYPT